MTIDEKHVDSYIRDLNAKRKYVKIPVDLYHKKFSVSDALGIPHSIRKMNFLIHYNTSERYLNFSEDIHVCDDEHAEKLLEHLNEHGQYWSAINVEKYYETFGRVA